MIEVYSNNIEVTEGAAIPFNNVTIKKGCTAELSAPATIQLNKCGVYMVSCDATAVNEGEASETLGIQLTKNGLPQPQAQASATGETGDTVALGFTTLVQVAENNTCCCCTSPTTIQVLNSGADATLTNINVSVTKIC